MASPMRSSRSTSQVAPRAMLTGKHVAGPMTTPAGPVAEGESGDAEALDVERAGNGRLW